MASPQAFNRWPILDLARGWAVVAMVVFHFTWDLGYFQLISYDISTETSGRIAAHLIAGSFLFLSGVGLALAHRGGLKSDAYLKRLGRIALAAALVSVGTWFAMRDDWIFFGILHCIALTSLAALPFLGLPVWVIAGAAIISLAAPLVLNLPIFDVPWLYWLGLNTTLPRTNDYVPFFPWFGIVLSGVGLGRLALGSPLWRTRFEAPRAVKKLQFAGRHSLVIYLVHQPLMIGTLWLGLAAGDYVAGLSPSEGDFKRGCVAQCTAAGREADFCAATCGCVIEKVRGTSVIGGDGSSPENSQRVAEAVALCVGTATPLPQ